MGGKKKKINVCDPPGREVGAVEKSEIFPKNVTKGGETAGKVGCGAPVRLESALFYEIIISKTERASNSISHHTQFAHSHGALKFKIRKKRDKFLHKRERY